MLPASQKASITKEYLIQKFLSETKHVPIPLFYLATRDKVLPGVVIEEKISFTGIKIDRKSFIVETAKALRETHSYSRKNKDLILKVWSLQPA